MIKFEAYTIGNRIAIKTIRKTYSKVTHLRIEEAKKTITNIKKNGWEIQTKGIIENKELRELITA